MVGRLGAGQPAGGWGGRGGGLLAASSTASPYPPGASSLWTSEGDDQHRAPLSSCAARPTPSRPGARSRKAAPWSGCDPSTRQSGAADCEPRPPQASTVRAELEGEDQHRAPRSPRAARTTRPAQDPDPGPGPEEADPARRPSPRSATPLDHAPRPCLGRLRLVLLGVRSFQQAPPPPTLAGSHPPRILSPTQDTRAAS